MRKFSLGLLLITTMLLFTPADPHTAAAANKPAKSTITVTGHAEITAVPDTAVIAFGVISTADSVTAAKTDNDQRMQAVLTAIARLGLKESQITTSDFPSSLFTAMMILKLSHLLSAAIAFKTQLPFSCRI